MNTIRRFRTNSTDRSVRAKVRTALAGLIAPARAPISFSHGDIPVITKETSVLEPKERLIAWRLRQWHHNQNPEADRPWWRRLLGLSTAFVANAAGLALAIAIPFAVALAIVSVSPQQETATTTEVTDD